MAAKKYYEVNGEMMTLHEAARRFNINPHTLGSRVRGQRLTMQQAVDKPISKGGHDNSHKKFNRQSRAKIDREDRDLRKTIKEKANKYWQVNAIFSGMNTCKG